MTFTNVQPTFNRLKTSRFTFRDPHSGQTMQPPSASLPLGFFIMRRNLTGRHASINEL